jgi:hypothetical protein
MALAVLSHRYRPLIPPLLGVTGVLYTVPSIAFFFLLLPVTGFGLDTAVIPLSAYTLQIIYRNTLAGLANVPADAKDAGRGMGMTDGELLRRVELPLAVPEIIAGLRIATVSTVAVATLAFETCTLHPRLNSDLLLAAAILHDVGKTLEFQLGAEIALSEAGALVGHVALGQQLVAERARRLDNFPEAKLHALSHCILAHHGPDALPGRRFRSAEALALCRLNTLDAGVKGALEHGLE